MTARDEGRVLLTMITDRRRSSAAALPDAARQAAGAGVDVVQLREKDLGDRALLELAESLVSALRGTPARVLVNGRPDVALLAGAHGVQLPEAGLPPGDVRRAFPALLVSVSCHSEDACRRAEQAGAHAVLLGPVFATPGKERPLGLAALAAAARAVAIPVHAVGGVEPARAASVRDAGASGIAAIRPFLHDPASGAAAYGAALR